MNASNTDQTHGLQLIISNISLVHSLMRAKNFTMNQINVQTNIVIYIPWNLVKYYKWT